MATRVDLGKKKLKKSDDRKLILRAHQVLEEARRITKLAQSTASQATDPSVMHPLVKNRSPGRVPERFRGDLHGNQGLSGI